MGSLSKWALWASNPVCEGSFRVDPAVRQIKLYLSSYSWQRDMTHHRNAEIRNNLKTRQPFLKPLCLLLCKTLFFVDVGHCATECCHPLLAWWHKHSCTSPQLLCSSAPPLQSHRSGAVMLLGVSMDSFSGAALHIPGRYVGGLGKIMEVTIGCKSRKSSMVVMEGLHGVQLLSYGSLH